METKALEYGLIDEASGTFGGEKVFVDQGGVRHDEKGLEAGLGAGIP